MSEEKDKEDILVLPSFEDLVFVDKLSKEKPRNKNKKHLSYKIIMISIFSLAFVVLSFFLVRAALISKAKAEDLASSAKVHIENSLEDFNNGDSESGLKELEVASDDIRKLKLIAQSWGQDMEYFRYYYGAKSKYVSMERVLNASYALLSTFSGLSKDIASISSSESDYNVNTNSSSKAIFNIQSSQEKILTIADNATKKLLDSKRELNRATNLPNDWQSSVDKSIETIDKGVESINYVKEMLTNDITWLSGADGKEKNVMVIFQNNAELRGGSGGSLGSFGIAKFKEGKLVNIDFAQNIYKLDNQFRAKSPVASPEALTPLVGPTLVLKDAGWSVDSVESFKNIANLYKLETGNTIDGVVMVDTTAVINLLDIVGPIDMKSYDKVISSKNFRDELEYEVHKGYFEKEGSATENEPKKIISDMMPIFIEKVLTMMSDKDGALDVLSSMTKSIKSKDILFYFTNEDFQKRLDALGCTGKVMPTLGDYLYINNSNIDGAKSSLNVQEKIEIYANINSNGKINNKITLFREHVGNGEWPDGQNKNFVRLLIPLDSKIETFDATKGNFQVFAINGYKNNSPYYVTKELGKDIVNFWMTTDPKNTSVMNLSYNPNYAVDTSGDEFYYNIYLQKQPGSLADNVSLTVSYPDGFSPENVIYSGKNSGSFKINLTLNSDKEIKIKFKKIK